MKAYDIRISIDCIPGDNACRITATLIDSGGRSWQWPVEGRDVGKRCIDPTTEMPLFLMRLANRLSTGPDFAFNDPRSP